MRNAVRRAAGGAVSIGVIASAAAGGGEGREDLTSYLRGARGAVLAQPEEGAGAEAGEPLEESDPLDGLSFRLRGGGRYSGEADLDDDSGSVSVARLASSLAVTGKPDERSSLTVQFGAEFSFYDFSDVGSLLPGGGEPIEEAAKYDIGLVYARQFEGPWGIFAGGSVEFVPASGASWDEAVLGSGFVGATYQFKEGLRVGLGVAVASRLEDDARFIPVPTIEWQINEKWRVGTVDRAIDIRGVEVAYQATESLEVFVLGGWGSREFRLDDDGPVPQGVFRDERVPLAGGISWAFAPNVSLEAAVGADMLTNYEVLDADGDEVVDVDSDAALSAWLGLTLRF